MISSTVVRRKVSPCATNKRGLLQGSLGRDEAIPCISWQRSGVIQAKSGAVSLRRSVESWLKSTILAMRVGLLWISADETNGLGLRPYSPTKRAGVLVL